MTGQDLWRSILRHAISGKFVPQDPRDEPTSQLLDKIAKEKKQLLKDGKLKKKDLASSIIYRGDDGLFYERVGKRVACIQDQIPFDIPDSWCWVRLSNISTFLSRGKSPKYTTTKLYPVFAQKCNTKYNGLTLELAKFLDPDTLKSWPERFKLLNNDIVINSTGKGTVGRVGLFNEAILGDYEFTVPDSHVTVVRISQYASSLFCYYVLLSDISQIYFESNLAGSTNQLELYKSVVENTFIPLPPEGEQERIVERLEELKELVDIYGLAYAKREALNADLGPSLRRGVLEEAIRGRLVEQRSEEGSAEPLLAQIEQEKRQLLKAGKLKKRDLTSSTIYRGDDGLFYERVGRRVTCIQDQIPFDIPSSWHWTRLHSVLLPMETKKPSSEFLYIDVAAVNNKKNTIDDAKLTAPADAPSRASRKVREGDVLFSTVRPYLRNVALVTKEFAEAIASTGFYVMSPATALCSKFLFYSMLSPYVINGLTAKMKGDNSPSVNNSDVSSFLFPLPPEGEQRRIVERLDKLMAQIDKL